jgi:trans-aconitate methyltransferase
VELGSGWGGMTRRLQKRFPDAKIAAFEKSIIPYVFSRAQGQNVRCSDLFDVNLTTVDLVFCYLSPWHMERLLPKFEKELKPGAVVVSASFPMKRTPDAETIVPGIVDIPVYLYRF